MNNPKTEIFEILSEIEGIKVHRERPDIIPELPSMTFRIQNNVPNYTLRGEIANQEVEAVIDIWTNDSIESSSLLSTLEAKMRGRGYLLTYSADVPDPERISHVTTRFNLVI